MPNAHFIPCNDHGRNHNLKLLVYSDNHAFATYSNHDKIRPGILKTMSDMDIVVENGDVSECKNLGLGITIEDVVKQRLKDLDEQIAIAPNCQFHIILGNHERYNDFVRPLEDYAKKHPQVHIHHSYVRIGDSMFVHGDWHGDDEKELLKEPYKDREKDSPLRAYGYKMLGSIAAAGYIAKKKFYPQQPLLERIHDRLMEECPEDMKGLKHIFFGHVHYLMPGAEHKGIQFHNTGAAIKLRDLFNMLKMEITPQGEAASIQPTENHNKSWTHNITQRLGIGGIVT